MKIRRILISTSNENKLKEFNKHFSNYGIETLQIPYFDVNDLEKSKKVSEKYTDDKFITVSIINEESVLSKEIVDGQILMNTSTLTVYDSLKNKICNYSDSIEGVIDLSKQKNENVFGWDDIFITLSTGKSYHEMRLLDLKVSARDQAISKYIKSRFHYSDRIDLNWNPLKNKEVINFETEKILSNSLFNNLKSHNLDVKLKQAINSGLFFRSAENRIQKNYWLPGLNAGIPLVPKKDAIHEATFMFHDFMHFLVPDLIIDNKDTKLYIIYRMMSEAFSLVYADMLFIDDLNNRNIKYDYSKRKIYPVYQELKNHYTLKEILYANAKYVIFGDDSLLKCKLKKETLENYKNKYEPFFVEDFKWTKKNVENILSQNLSNWTKNIPKYNLKNTYTTSQFRKMMKTDNIFEEVFNHYINIFFDNTVENVNPLDNAFKRYLIGQSALFSKYLFNDKVKYFYSKVLNIIENINNITIEEIHIHRKMLRKFIKEMVKDNLISSEDGHTYKEVYPIFKPFYVFYDEDKNYYQSLKEISNNIL